MSCGCDVSATLPSLSNLSRDWIFNSSFNFLDPWGLVPPQIEQRGNYKAFQWKQRANLSCTTEDPSVLSQFHFDKRTLLSPWNLTESTYSQHLFSAFCPRLLALSRCVIRECAHGHLLPSFHPCVSRRRIFSLTEGLLSMSRFGLVHKENSCWHNCSSGQESQAEGLLPCLWSWAGFLFLSAQQAPLGQLPTLLHSLRPPTPTLALPPILKFFLHTKCFPESSGISEYWPFKKQRQIDYFCVYLVIFLS